LSLSFFKRSALPTETRWLNQKELHDLQALAEKINTSTAASDKQQTQQAGQLNSRILGSGNDYAESRPYQNGDDPRSINWRLSARSQETFVKTYYADSRPTLAILLDQRKAMLFGTRKRLKINQALRASVLLSKAGVIHGLDFKAWVLTDHSLEYFDNSDAFLLKANKYEATQERDFSASSNANVCFGSALKEIRPQLATDSLFYIISDFSGLQKQQLAALASHCAIQTFHIIDPAEVSLNNIGSLSLEDSNGIGLKIETQNDAQRVRFSSKVGAIIDSRKKTIADLNINYTRIMTDADSIHTQIYLPIKSTT